LYDGDDEMIHKIKLKSSQVALNRNVASAQSYNNINIMMTIVFNIM